MDNNIIAFLRGKGNLENDLFGCEVKICNQNEWILSKIDDYLRQRDNSEIVDYEDKLQMLDWLTLFLLFDKTGLKRFKKFILQEYGD